MGAQQIKRLEEESEQFYFKISFYSDNLSCLEFILKETTTLDDIGNSKLNKNKGKASKAGRPRRNLQKSRYVFNFSVQSKPQYMDYFKPDDRVVENRLLGISDMVYIFVSILYAIWHVTQLKSKYSKQNTPTTTNIETQTQEETQPSGPSGDGGPKRLILEHVDRPSKRMKISVAAAVDLAE